MTCPHDLTVMCFERYGAAQNGKWYQTPLLDSLTALPSRLYLYCRWCDMFGDLPQTWIWSRGFQWDGTAIRMSGSTVLGAELNQAG